MGYIDWKKNKKVRTIHPSYQENLRKSQPDVFHGVEIVGYYNEDDLILLKHILTGTVGKNGIEQSVSIVLKRKELEEIVKQSNTIRKELNG